jgi:hypothetical protein
MWVKHRRHPQVEVVRHEPGSSPELGTLVYAQADGGPALLELHKLEPLLARNLVLDDGLPGMRQVLGRNLEGPRPLPSDEVPDLI